MARSYLCKIKEKKKKVFSPRDRYIVNVINPHEPDSMYPVSVPFHGTSKEGLVSTTKKKKNTQNQPGRPADQKPEQKYKQPKRSNGTEP